jgi:glycosyltransferase involved in cell wall biosynthesis
MKVSVVTPSFNQGRFIERTLRSVATQSGSRIDHMVVDGGSTDDTVDVLKTFDGTIRWVSESDKGQTDAVNKGIRSTDGEIIGWLNSDDIYYPDAVSRVVAFFNAHPEIDVVYGMADHIDQDDKAFEAYPSEPWNFERLKDTCFICQPATFFRRRVVEKYGLLDDALHYCMDYEFWLRLGKAGVLFGYLEDKLAGSRLYAENKTLGSRIKVHAEINDVLKKLFSKVPERWVWNYAHAVVEEKTDRSKQPRRFALCMLVVAAVAAWRWNGAMSPDMKVGIRDLWRRFRTA